MPLFDQMHTPHGCNRELEALLVIQKIYTKRKMTQMAVQIRFNLMN